MIRPQYHFRESFEGLCAWNVARLIQLARPLPIQNVPLGEIAELEETYWGNGYLSVKEVADHAALIDEVDISWPILLCAEGRVMDGMHRVARAWMSAQATIPARRFKTTPPPDHIGVSPDDLSYDPSEFRL